jgi:uncharacterized membrane protein YedE/YeeE
MTMIPVASRSSLQLPKSQIVALFVALGLLALLTGIAWQTQSRNHAMLLLTGAALGIALYHASFGFTAAFRVLMSDARSAGLRAQMILLGLACILFFPPLAHGTLFGSPVGGFVMPVGYGVVVGAFLFGIGMQLGGGCGSGTLFTVGGGNVRMVITLVFFIVGSMIGLENLSYWERLPNLGSVSVVEVLGWPGALAVNLAIFAGVYFAVSGIERRRHGKLQPIGRGDAATGPMVALVRGPWPLIWGAVALALLNFLTLYLAGRPWGITSAFALWGAKIMSAVGIDMSQWSSWSDAGQQAALKSSVLADITSIMDIGLVLGALAASALAQKFRPGWSIPPLQIISAVLGGLLMGYGARLSYGCNIGAFFSGIASGSLHGWLWIACAFAGNWLGVVLRPVFGMAVERSK